MAEDLEILLKDPILRQKTLLAAIRTCPIPIQTGDLVLTARGMPKGEGKAYVKGCREKGIKPFTHAQFGYSFQRKIESISSQPSLRFPKECNPELKEEILALFLGTGRIAKITLDPLPHLEPGEVESHSINTFLEANYDLSHVDLWLASFRRRGYESGTSYFCKY